MQTTSSREWRKKIYPKKKKEKKNLCLFCAFQRNTLSRMTPLFLMKFETFDGFGQHWGGQESYIVFSVYLLQSSSELLQLTHPQKIQEYLRSGKAKRNDAKKKKKKNGLVFLATFSSLFTCTPPIQPYFAKFPQQQKNVGLFF